jgi:hypothetical protein
MPVSISTSERGVDYVKVVVPHVVFLGICVFWIPVFHLLRWIAGFGLSVTDAGFYGLLRSFLLMLMIAYGYFMALHAWVVRDKDEQRRHYEAILRRRGIEPTDDLVQQAVNREALEYNLMMAASVLPMTVVFALMAHYWQYASTEVPIFAHAPHGVGDVLLFSTDLAFRGIVFDFMEHFEIHLSDIRMNFSNYWFVGVSFVFRLYCAVLVLKALIGYVVFRKTSAARQTK